IEVKQLLLRKSRRQCAGKCLEPCGVDDGRPGSMLSHCKVSRIQEVRRPVEQARRQPVMLCDREQVPNRRHVRGEVLNRPALPGVEELFFTTQERWTARLGLELPIRVGMTSEDPAFAESREAFM